MYKINNYHLSSWVLIGFSSYMLAAFAWPAILFPIYFIWNGILNILHQISSRILLGIIFYLIFTPVGIFMRLINRDILQISYEKYLKSYRNNITHEKNDIRRPY